MYICEKDGHCICCTIADENEKPCDHIAKVEYVVHAEWIKGKSGLYSCSNCNATCPYDAQGDVIEYWECNYCPKCGALMNGKE